MSWHKRRRFYHDAGVVQGTDGYSVVLDGHPVRSPGGRLLAVPSLSLATAMAEEWKAQDGEIRPHTMPLTQLATTATDQVGPEREAVVEHLAGYAATDLVCYRAESGDLAGRQADQWGPLLDWLEDAFGARLEPTRGIIAVDQPDDALAILRDAIDDFDDLALSALASATQATGSLVLALALAAGRVDPESAFAASQVDETYQMEFWGHDAEVVERQRALKAEIEAAARVFQLLAE